MKPKWVRVLGVIAAVFVVFLYALSSREIVGYGHDKGLIIFYLAVIIFPSFLVVFLTAFGRLWWSFSISIWLFIAALFTLFDNDASPRTIILLLAITTVCTTPFLDRACKSDKLGELGQTNKQPDAQQGTSADEADPRR